MLIEEYGITKPIDVIPTGINNAYYAASNGGKEWLKKRFNLNHEDRVLLYVGRLGKEKNINFLIDAMEDIVITMPRVKLLIVGTGIEESSLKILCYQKPATKCLVLWSVKRQ